MNRAAGGERIDRPPGPEQAVRLPPDLGQRFLLFVDTEEEFDWSGPRPRSTGPVSAIAALPSLHRRLADRGVRPTYLMTHPVVIDARASATLAAFEQAGEAVLGAQLHPWVTPPMEEGASDRESFAGNLPRALEERKIATLAAAIAARFGARPLVYRAGRYGVGRYTGEILARAGFRLDASVRAGYHYRQDGGPDFTGFVVEPFWAAPGSSLLALPLGHALTGRMRRFGGPLFDLAGAVPRARGLLARAGLLARVPLTPEGTTLAEAEEAIRVLAGEGVPLLSLSFHSPSAEPGHTPYVRDLADLRRFERWWDGVLDRLDREGVRPLGADRLIEAADAARGGSTG